MLRNRLRTAVHQLYQALGRPLRFRVYNSDVAWPYNRDYRAVWARFPGPKSRYVHERRFTLFNLARASAAVEGDSAECGAFHGEGSFIIMAAREGTKAEHHIFDSFAGLSLPNPERDRAPAQAIRQWNAGDLSVPEETVQGNLSNFSRRFRTWPGWIPQRFEEVSDRRFAFVHIDVDLYEPTRDCLSFFYPRLERGGILVCDDYGSLTCPGARQAMNEFFAKRQEQVIEVTSGQGFVFKL